MASCVLSRRFVGSDGGWSHGFAGGLGCGLRAGAVRDSHSPRVEAGGLAEFSAHLAHSGAQVFRERIGGGRVEEVSQAEVIPVPVDGVVGEHQRPDLGPDLADFGVRQPGLAQAAQRDCLVLGRGLGVDEGLKQVAPYIGAFADGDLAGQAEPLQFLPLHGGDEQGFPGQGADLRRCRGGVGIPDR